MNAIEHGNHNRAELPVGIKLLASPDRLTVRITDQGGGDELQPTPVVPDLDAKLAGEQSPRGWGLFLIEHMVDELHTRDDGTQHTIELVLKREGAPNGRDTV